MADDLNWKQVDWIPHSILGIKTLKKTHPSNLNITEISCTYVLVQKSAESVLLLACKWKLYGQKSFSLQRSTAHRDDVPVCGCRVPRNDPRVAHDHVHDRRGSQQHVHWRSQSKKSETAGRRTCLAQPESSEEPHVQSLQLRRGLAQSIPESKELR